MTPSVPTSGDMTTDGDKRKRRKGGGTVIHVAFGANGGRVTDSPAPTREP